MLRGVGASCTLSHRLRCSYTTVPKTSLHIRCCIRSASSCIGNGSNNAMASLLSSSSPSSSKIVGSSIRNGLMWTNGKQTGLDSASSSNLINGAQKLRNRGFIYQIASSFSSSDNSKHEIQKSLSKLEELVVNKQVELFCRDMKSFSERHRDEVGKEIIYKLNPMIEVLAPTMNIQQIFSVLSSFNDIDYRWSDTRCRPSIEVLVLNLSDTLRKNPVLGNQSVDSFTSNSRSSNSSSSSSSSSSNSNSSGKLSSKELRNSGGAVNIEKSIAEAHCILGILRNLVEMKVNLKQLPKKKGYIERFVDAIRQSVELIVLEDKHQERRFKVITKMLRDLGSIHFTFRDLPPNFLTSVESIVSNNIGKGLLPDEASDYIFALNDLRASWKYMSADSKAVIANMITYFLPKLNSKEAAVLFYGLHKIQCPYLSINENVSNLVVQLFLRLFSGSNFSQTDFEAISIMVYSLSVAGKDWNQLSHTTREIIERYINNSVSYGSSENGTQANIVTKWDKSSVGYFLYGLGELKCPLYMLSQNLRYNINTNILSNIHNFGVTELTYVACGLGKSLGNSAKMTDDVAAEVNEVTFALLRKFESLLLPETDAAQDEGDERNGKMLYNSVLGGSESIESLGTILYSLGCLGRNFNELENPQRFVSILESIISTYANNSPLISTVTTANIIRGVSRIGLDWSCLSAEFHSSLAKILNISITRADENYMVEILEGLHSIKHPLPEFNRNHSSESNIISNHNEGFADPFVDSLLKTVHTFIYKSTRPWGNASSFSRGIANLCFFVKDFNTLSSSTQSSIFDGIQKYTLSFSSDDFQLLLKGLSVAGVTFPDLPPSTQIAVMTSLKRFIANKKFSVDEASDLFRSLSEFKIFWGDIPFDTKQSISDRLAKLMITELGSENEVNVLNSSKSVDSYISLLYAMGHFKMESLSLRPSVLMSLDYLTNQLLENSACFSPRGDESASLDVSNINNYYSSINNLLGGLASIKYKVSLATADNIWNILLQLAVLGGENGSSAGDAISSNSSNNNNINSTIQSLLFTLGQLNATIREVDLSTVNEIIHNIFRRNSNNTDDVRQLVVDTISCVYLLSTIHYPSYDRLRKDVQEELNDSLLLLSFRNLDYPVPSMLLLLPSLVRLKWNFPTKSSANSKQNNSEHKRLLLSVTEKIIPILEVDEFATIVSSLILLFPNELGDGFKSMLCTRLEDFMTKNVSESNIGVDTKHALAKLSVICDFIFSEQEKKESKSNVFSFYKSFGNVNSSSSSSRSNNSSSSGGGGESAETVEQFEAFVTTRLLGTTEQSFNSDLMELLLSSKKQ